MGGRDIFTGGSGRDTILDFEVSQEGADCGVAPGLAGRLAVAARCSFR